ncbi:MULTISPECIES: hypothetical protein [unclassified Bradyrhizobium]|uniref:hypothetical protein n=1 Tax=unclassified Bradyrhizobium TaxID=2631580 RepID=UPI0020B30CC4|nr:MULTISPECIES: hypothetical protein [unclassified Bradyrhizobium]MCP3401922.1 hypothetical protein [Bradyrhizobium sp. CCGB20]MCP3410407.1 hypothetical protein [Bradyrhizobium sp. CCGB01]
MSGKRRRFKQTVSLEERLAVGARLLRERAMTLPPGPDREALLRKAKEIEMTGNVSHWLSSHPLSSLE